MFIVGEKLWASFFQLSQHSAKNRWASFFQPSAKNRLGTNISFKMLGKFGKLGKLKNDAQRFFAESWESWENDAQSFSPTINMCYRVCFCIIIYRCDSFACTP